MSVKIKIDKNKNKYNINLENLITMGKRANNPKRNFLFISKVLGKHLEVKPDICRAIGFILSSTVYGKNENIDELIKYINCKSDNNENIKKLMNKGFKSSENVLVLGFAETATGLGMAVASSIENCYYITTTREDITSIRPLIDFEEEHSHATNHKCFPKDIEAICKTERIILVDDEITTGNSMINIIKGLKTATNISKYTVLSILDWRSEENIKNFNNLAIELDIEIQVSSVISGKVTINDLTIYNDNNEIELKEKQEVIDLQALERIEITKKDKETTYFKNSGRFGVHHSEIVKLEEYCNDIAKKIQELVKGKEKLLVLGHGESIYIPSRVAAYLEGQVYFKSTTRSPIYCSNDIENPIKEKYVFFDENVKYYFYNKDHIENNYDAVILLTENDLDIKLCSNLTIVKL